MTDERPRTCLHCGRALEQGPTGRPREYCDQACRQAAHRDRRAALSVEQPAPTPQPVDVPEGIEPNAGFPARGRARPGRGGSRFPKVTMAAGDDPPLVGLGQLLALRRQ